MKQIIQNPGSPLYAIQGTRAIDRTGLRYGRLTAIAPTDERRGGGIVWRCRCDCGRETYVTGKNLAGGKVSSCGCLRRETLAGRATDRTGKRYGRLTALEPMPERRGGGVVWRCRCDCGGEVLVRGNYLTTGEVTSCGKCSNAKYAAVMAYIEQLIGSGVDMMDIFRHLVRARM